MDTFGKMLLIAMPAFLALILVEFVAGWFMRHEKPRTMDTISSLSSGMTNILKSTLGLTVVLISYPWFFEHFSLVTWTPGSFWPYLITFVFMDFTGYWIHRLQHRVNFFWNHHVIHHSSEEFNLPCALRQSISVFTNIYTLLLLPLSVIGIPHKALLLVGPIHLFAQFWYHTRYIDKMGFLEHILVTPSHHRVHHAMNDIYMDKNYSQIFIIWDKLFGTFQPELPEEPCVYGIRRPAHTWNPYLINFQHLWVLMKDAWQTKSWADKLRIWFMPTGWRPADVAEAHPIPYIKNMNELQKFNPSYSALFQVWGSVYLSVVFLLTSFLFYRLGEIDRTAELAYGIFLLAALFSLSSFMDKKTYGLAAILLTTVAAVVFYLQNPDWFGLQNFWNFGPVVVAAFFAVSGIAALFLYKTDFAPTQPVLQAG